MEHLISQMEKMLEVGISVALPIILTALVVGVLVSLIQAATQIQEMTLSFIPKIIAVIAVIGLLGMSMLNQLVAFMRDSFLSF